MPFKLHMKMEKDYLYVESSGTIGSIEEALAYIEPQMARARREETTRLLADERELVIRLAYSDIVAIGDYFDSKNVQKLGLRIAVLQSNLTPDFHKNYETVALNRAIAYMSFPAKEDALEWLRQR